jgi:hypothetical protein
MRDHMTDAEIKLLDAMSDEDQEEFYLDFKWNLPTEGVYESIQLAFENQKLRRSE